jgi:hypothetical protein
MARMSSTGMNDSFGGIALHHATDNDRRLWAETVDLAGGWFSTWVELGLGEHRK